MDLTPMEKEYLETVKSGKCNEKRIKELKMAGRGHYIERESAKKQMKDSARDFKKYAKNWDSIKGKWSEAPPPPPAFPSDCSIM